MYLIDFQFIARNKYSRNDRISKILKYKLYEFNNPSSWNFGQIVF